MRRRRGLFITVCRTTTATRVRTTGVGRVGDLFFVFTILVRKVLASPARCLRTPKPVGTRPRMGEPIFLGIVGEGRVESGRHGELLVITSDVDDVMHRNHGRLHYLGRRSLQSGWFRAHRSCDAR